MLFMVSTNDLRHVRNPRLLWAIYEDARKIEFADDDLLYVLGDVVDRGPEPMTVLLDSKEGGHTGPGDLSLGGFLWFPDSTVDQVKCVANQYDEHAHRANIRQRGNSDPVKIIEEVREPHRPAVYERVIVHMAHKARKRCNNQVCSRENADVINIPVLRFAGL